MKPIFALSSCWLSRRHQDGYAMMQEMAGLGFTHVELSHGVRITLVPGLLRAVEDGMVKVSTCHNFCPLPPGVMQSAPNLFQPSALDPREHDQWVRQTKRSIDFSAQVGAKILVCHLGSVRFFWFNPASKVEGYAEERENADLRQDAVYSKIKDAGLAKLRKRAPKFLEAVKQSIGEVLEHAKQKGIKLGFENRERFDELPLDDGFDELLSSFPADAPVGYWHDTGHADIKEKMGLLDHKAHLTKLAARTLGFHLHDVGKGGKDHDPVGSGRIDWDMISQFWRPEHLLTLELSPKLTTEQVVASKLKVEALMERRFGGKTA